MSEENQLDANQLVQIGQSYETSSADQVPKNKNHPNTLSQSHIGSPTPPAQFPIISFLDKEAQERKHWETIKHHLLNNDLEFKTGPIQSHIQFSNYCNLSCIMCWNLKNPRTERVSPELLEKIETQLGPHLSVMVPFSGSEPLILTWDQTRANG